MTYIGREFLKEFIELFESHPALWNIKSAEYKNRHLKTIGWKALLNKYKEIDKTATLEIVRKKLNCLRSSYRRELCKRKERIGSGSDEEYVSSLWYFDLIDFLRDNMYKKSVKRSYGDPLDMKRVQNLMSEQTEEESNEFSEEQSKSVDQDTETYDDDFEEEKPCFSKRQKTIDNDVQPKVIRNCENLIQQSSVRDEAEVFSEGWALIYRQLNADQKIFAKRIIDEALMLGQFGQLTYASVKCLDAIVPINSQRFLHESQAHSINHNLEISTSSTTNNAQNSNIQTKY